MARVGWGKAGYTISSGVNDATKTISKDRWNLPLNKGEGILGFDAQTETSATTITPNRSVLILNGSTEVTKFLIADSEEYDILYVFQGASASASLTNTTGTPTADGEIVGLGSASTITLSETTPKILIRKSNGTYDLWVEYGGSGTAAASELTGTILANNVVTSSLTTVGTITGGTWTGTAVADTYLGTGINANKIADGTVTSAEFQYLGDVTSLVQAQIDAKQATLTFGIADTNKVQIDGTTTSTGQYSKFTTTGVIGASAATQKTDLSLNNVENTALSTWAGTSNVVTLGTVTTGTWTGTDVAIADGGTGAGTAQTAIDALTAVSAATNEYVLTKDTSTGNALWKVGGGGAHTEQEWDVYDPTTFTPTAAVANTEAYMYTEKIDTDNDGLFIQMWKNGASQAVQIA